MSDLLFEIRDGSIAILTLNRPEVRNAVNASMRNALFEAFSRIAEDGSIRVAILTGAGDKSFCAGADLKELAELKAPISARDFFPILGDNVALAKPVIAAVNGDALGGGWLLAQMCDLCVASRHARLGITEARFGRGFAWAAPLAHMIPQKVLAELLMTGKPISAERAYEIGFVNQLAEPADVMRSAMELAEDIASAAPLSVAAAKEMIAASRESGQSDALDAAYRIFEKVYASQDAIEGALAFREKRKSNWRGM